MNIFQDQITERRKADQQALEESFGQIAGVVLGRHLAEKLEDDRIITQQAVDEILKYYHCKPVDIPKSVKSAEEQLDYCLRRYGMMQRTIELEEGWYNDAYGPVIAFTREGGRPVAVFPDFLHGYYYHDQANGKKIKLGRKTSSVFDREAICFYHPLPMKKLGIPDLIIFMKQCMDINDWLLLIVSTLALSAVGLLVPQITAALTGPVLDSRNAGVLIGAAVCLICVTISSGLIETIKGMFNKRIELKISIGVESAMMMRLISLPVSFFRQYSPGELQNRSLSVNLLCSLIQNIVMATGLTALGSLLYLTQIMRFTPALMYPAVIVILASVFVSLITTYVQMGISRKKMKQAAKEAGLSYALITGMQKIRLAGAEKRAFAKWLEQYAKSAELEYNPPVFIKLNQVLSTGITLFSTVIFYYVAVKNGIDQASYFAFTAAYGVVMTAFMQAVSIASSAAEIRPILEMAEPFLNTVPEISESRELVTSISGRVELDHVTFRYDENTPYILNDLSLSIKPGDYVAIVGRTGCGKSTLIRLLLGFEEPEKGAVYYDGRDIKTLDVGSLRRQIGTVTQNGGLFQGDIFSNISITSPFMTVEEAWEAAETAGIAEDIRNMPMGMYTLISEGQGGISGGQKQRLMIARAVASKPKLLIFDEATSALDNVTQKQVSESLDRMGCTRIVVAHRLSTIRHCDRIVVLDGGRIIEDGTYDELIEKGGFFAELVERQRLDV